MSEYFTELREMILEDPTDYEGNQREVFLALDTGWITKEEYRKLNELNISLNQAKED